MARKKLDTLTEQMFYVLLALRQERHGYGIMQYAADLTGGAVSIGAGTLYALLDRFEKDGLIKRTRLDESRKFYRITPEGMEVLEQEYRRIRRQAADMERVLWEETQPVQEKEEETHEQTGKVEILGLFGYGQQSRPGMAE